MVNEYVVERILKEKRVKQRNGRSKTMYLVKWEGYNEETWEPVRNLSNCREKIDEFRAQRDSVSDEQEASATTAMEVDGNPSSMEHGNGERGHETEDEECKDDRTTSVNESVTEVVQPVAGEDAADVFDFGFDASDEECVYEENEEECNDMPSVQEEEQGQVDAAKKTEKRQSSVQGEGYLDSDESGDDTADDEQDEVLVMVNERNDSDDEEDVDLCQAVAGPHPALLPDRLRELSVNGFINAHYGEDTTKAAEDVSPFEGAPAVTEAAASAAKSMQPIDLFFFFLPKRLWQHIAKETNRYERQTREERIRKARMRLQQKLSRAVAADKFADVQRKICMFEDVLPHEILVMLGLLIARSLCPMKMAIEQHWATTQQGAIPAGTWSRFMARQRFRDIFRFLHFSDNKDAMAKKDRAWKIRPVVETLQRTFMRGLTMGRWVAFDEMVIPSRSARNTVRIYLKNKPHKYGTKLFAVCCGETNYCARIEVYCGSRQDSRVVDTLSGPAAVLRNLRALWPASKIDRS